MRVVHTVNRPAHVPSEPQRVESLLVIGTGSAGYRHLMNARALGVPDLSVFRTGLGEPRGPLPEEVRVETELGCALGGGVQAVVIANPTSLHVEYALEAVRAGCHLLIEKPLSDSLDGIERLRNEIRLRSLRALVGYQFRFHPALLQVRRWLQQDAIGVVVSAHAHWGEYLPDWQPWRDYRSSYSARIELGGGVLLTLSHPIDYLRWLLGEIGRVSAMTARRSGLELNVEDTALIHLEFASGAIASVSLDYVRRPPQHSLTIIGRRGVIHWDNAGGVARLETQEGRNPPETARTPDRFERNHLFFAEMSHFFACIRGRSEPVCSVEDGERVVRICLAARQSAREGRRFDV